MKNSKIFPENRKSKGKIVNRIFDLALIFLHSKGLFVS